jgi:hypothetical protein
MSFKGWYQVQRIMYYEKQVLIPDTSYSLLKKNLNGGSSEGVHLFPFRTEKLSPSALMVLP